MRSALIPGSRPREPLYCLRELGDRLGCPARTLRALLTVYPRLRPEAPLKSRSASPGSGPVKLYRLSDFRSWLLANEIDLTRYGK